MIYILTDSPPATSPRTIGAYRLATELRQSGYTVEVIDFLSEWTPEEVLQYIDSGPIPLWIGFSSTFSGHSKHEIEGGPRAWPDKLTRFNEKDFWFFDEIKKRAITVIGGAKAERMKHIYTPDYVVTGYADAAIIAISDFLSGKINKLNYKKETINLIYRDISYISKTINCETMYPVTDASNIQTVFHETDYIQPNEVLPLEISRGCIFKCAFCAFPLNGKTKNDYVRPKEQLLEDIKTYQEKYKSNRYFFMDDTFNDTVEKMQLVKEVYDSVNPFEFWAYGRLDLLAAKPEMMELVNKIGWKYFSFGVETFNRNAGKKIGKGADPEKLKATLTELKTIYPESWLLFEMIIGLPGESKNSVEESVQWFLDNPSLWEEVHFKELSIPNTKYTTWHSEMSKDPEKYGVQIIDSESLKGSHNWKHETMTASEASSILSSVDITINDFRPRNKNNYFINLADLPTVEDDDMIPQLLKDKIYSIGRQYVNNKFKGRAML